MHDWLYAGAGILIVLVMWEVNPELGGVFLMLVVIVMLNNGVTRGALSFGGST
jgi:hypothetical protein